MEASATGGAPWRIFDQRSGNWNTGWWTFAQGNKSLATLPGMVGSNTGRVRLHFRTDAETITGVGWYADAVEVFRDAEWHGESPASGGFYRCSVPALGSYTNGVSGEFYSPFLALGAGPRYLHLTMRGNASLPDAVQVWVLDVAAGTWSQVGSLQGSHPTWAAYEYNLSAYANKTIVIALWLDSTYSALKNTGQWDLGQMEVNDHPTAVELARFEATLSGATIRVEWETATELDNRGFNLYRSETADGQYVKLNGS